MSSPLLADAVLLLHFALVLFIIGGLLAVPLGNCLRWNWVNLRRWRLIHLLAMLWVMVQAWLGWPCPLTVVENRLRHAGSADTEQGFIASWVHKWLFWQAPGWLFTVAYTAFALLAILAWWRFPPRLRRR